MLCSRRRRCIYFEKYIISLLNQHNKIINTCIKVCQYANVCSFMSLCLLPDIYSHINTVFILFLIGINIYDFTT